MKIHSYLNNLVKLTTSNTNKIWQNSFKTLRNVNHTSLVRYSVSRVMQQQEQQTTSNSSEFGSSINDDEYKKFQRLSQQWWKENGEFEALHRFNSLRVPWIKTTLFDLNKESQLSQHDNKLLIKEPLLGLNILDVGCGGGILAEPLARLGASVTAIDMVKDNVIVAQTHLNSYANKSNDSKLLDRIRYVNCALEDLTLSEQNFQYFDAIVMSEVIEHVNHPDIFINNASKLLKNKSPVFLTTLNRTYISYFLSIIMAEYVLGIVPRGTHDWNKFFSPEEINSMFEKNNLFTKSIMGTIYNPLTKQWSWVKDTSVNYCMYAIKNEIKS